MPDPMAVPRGWRRNLVSGVSKGVRGGAARPLALSVKRRVPQQPAIVSSAST